MKRKLVWFGLWTGSLVLISFFGGAISYGFFFALTIVPVVAFFYVLAVLFSFRIYQEIGSREVVCGQKTDYYFVLQNNVPFAFAGLRVVFFPENFEIEGVKPHKEYELLPGDRFSFETKMFCKYRGEYDVGVSAVVITDFFGLIHFRYRLPSTVKAIVLPRIIQMDMLHCLREIEAPMHRDRLQGQEVMDSVVRDYTRGDSMRAIHWKASAKTQTLKVRNYYDETKQGVTLYCERKKFYSEQKEFLPLENKMLETLLALTAYFLGQDIMTYVTVGEDDRFRCLELSDDEAFHSFYRELTEFYFQPDVDEEAEVALFLERFAIEPTNIVMLVMHSISDDMMKQIYNLRDLGVYIVIYLISDEVQENLLMNSNDRVQIISVGTEDDLQAVL